MAGFRVSGSRSGLEDKVYAGDTIFGTDSDIAVTTVGATTLTASQMLNSIITRSGSTAAYTDTFDSASNIMTALGNSGIIGNGPIAAVGLTWRMILRNTVAYAQTITLGAGMIAGINSQITGVAASTAREFVFTIASTQIPTSAVVNTVNGSPNITFASASGYYPLDNNTQTSPPLQIGATVIGTGIPAGTTISSFQTNGSGITTVTLSANATATGMVSASFGPTITVDTTGTYGL